MTQHSRTLLKQQRLSTNTVVLYDGPSQLDGQPTVVLLSGIDAGSNNSKTGAMLQTWILRSDIHPVDANHTGADASICGDCTHRGAEGTGRTCYVTWFAPNNLFKTYQRGSYRYAFAAEYPLLIKGRGVRFGAYGDPAAVPLSIWDNLAEHAGFVTGYTHQWADADPRLARHCMASVETLEERAQAKSLGFRTFRCRPDDHRAEAEFVCPASEEAGKKLTCAECKACGGTSSPNTADVTIKLHGGTPQISNARKKGLLHAV